MYLRIYWSYESPGWIGEFIVINYIFLLMVTILAADQCLWPFKLSWHSPSFLTRYQAGMQAGIFPMVDVDWQPIPQKLWE